MPFVCSLCTLELFFGVSLFNTRFLFTYQKKKTNKQTFDYLTSKLGMIDIYDPVWGGVENCISLGDLI